MSDYRDSFREVEKETIWTLPRIFLVIVGVLILFYGLGFLATGGDLAIYRFWAPKQADAQRVVYTHTQAYVQGEVKYLNQLRGNYENATGPQKGELRQEILDEAGTVDLTLPDVPADLREFIYSLKENGNE